MFQTRTFVLTFQQDGEYLSRIGEISPDFELKLSSSNKIQKLKSKSYASQKQRSAGFEHRISVRMVTVDRWKIRSLQIRKWA